MGEKFIRVLVWVFFSATAAFMVFMVFATVYDFFEGRNKYSFEKCNEVCGKEIPDMAYVTMDGVLRGCLCKKTAEKCE